MYQGFAVKARGHNHKEKGTACQDAVSHKCGDDYAIAAVSDGHGGEQYFRSSIGASVAVNVANRCLQIFLEKYRESLADTVRREKYLGDIAGHIINEWRSAIKKHFMDCPLNEREKKICIQYDMRDSFQARFYGATLLYACLTPAYSFAAQIGDGACVFLYTDKVPDMPISEDLRLGFGVTTSLCDSDAVINFRYSFRDKDEPGGLPQAIFLCTDGVVDSYVRESFLLFNQAILDKMNENKKFAEKHLDAWLPILSERGSGDDVSIVGIYQPVEKVDDFFSLSGLWQ